MSCLRCHGGSRVVPSMPQGSIRGSIGGVLVLGEQGCGSDPKLGDVVPINVNCPANHGPMRRPELAISRRYGRDVQRLCASSGCRRQSATSPSRPSNEFGGG